MRSLWRKAKAMITTSAPGRHFEAGPSARRLLVFTEHFNATYFISFEIPLMHLRSQGQVGFSAYAQVDVEAGGAGCWERWILDARPEVVVLTRYGRPDGVQILAFCRMHGIPVVYHIDDDLLALPASLGQDVIKRHASTAVLQARRTLLAGCDLVYASTRPLAEVLRARFPAQRIYHGIYAPYLEVLPQLPAERETEETIGYMGSQGHREDLALVTPALVQLMRERPTLRFETFGTIGMPEVFAEFGSRVRHHAVQKSYQEFLSSLARLRWRIGLAPLVDEPFNRCKAPTKFIEYSSCGIATVASSLPVYAEAIPSGGGTLVEGDDWRAAMAQLLDDPGRARRQLEAARAHCSQVYGLDALARQVLQVMDLEQPEARLVGH